ncbi:hypothetical protein DMC47_36240 [Nostoc sp. 3335mG]|nr:hypothetical protein DMC47_36240 [Nostoc sp. 3335mG]
MPFDPLDYRPQEPSPDRPGPTAPTARHGGLVLAGLVIVTALLTGLIEFPYTLDGIGRIADALGF